MMQLSLLKDYHQRLALHSQQLCQLRYRRTECEQQMTSSERILSGHLQRLSDKQKRLANLRTLKEQAQMRTSAAAALGKLLQHFLVGF